MNNSANRGGGSRFLYEPFDGSLDNEQKEYRELLRSLGTADQIKQRIDALDSLIEDKRRRNWLFSSVKTVAGWSAVVATGWLAFKGLVIEFLSGIRK